MSVDIAPPAAIQRIRIAYGLLAAGIVLGAGMRVAAGYGFLVRAADRGLPVGISVWVITILPLLLGGLAAAVALRVPFDRLLVAATVLLVPSFVGFALLLGKMPVGAFDPFVPALVAASAMTAWFLVRERSRPRYLFVLVGMALAVVFDVVFYIESPYYLHVFVGYPLTAFAPLVIAAWLASIGIRPSR